MPSNYNGGRLRKKMITHLKMLFIFFIVLLVLLFLSLSNILPPKTTNSYILLAPPGIPTKAIIFYPGLLVSPNGYISRFSPFVHHSTTAVFLMKSSFILPFSPPDTLMTIIKQYPSIHEWYIAGHSLGGTIACQQAVANPSLFSGLILIASHCGKAISQYQGKVVVILGSDDPFETKNRAMSTLPKNARVISIQGANHSIFAETLPFPFDHPATIKKKIFIQKFSDLLRSITQ